MERIARATGAPLDVVIERYQDACSALNDTARITNFVPLLAAQSVRRQLQSPGAANHRAVHLA
jgi:hypothetical protein